MSTKTLLAVGLAALLIVVAAFFAISRASEKPSNTPTSTPELATSTSPQSSCPDFQEAEITIADTRLTVAVAATAEEREQGLSGCGHLPEQSGMLFPYTAAKETAYWMRAMLIPIDIIWIRDGKVVGIEENVPTPASNTALKDLPQYRSPGLIDTVLEIKSGGAKEYNIRLGSVVTVSN